MWRWSMYCSYLWLKMALRALGVGLFDDTQGKYGVNWTNRYWDPIESEWKSHWRQNHKQHTERNRRYKSNEYKQVLPLRSPFFFEIQQNGNVLEFKSSSSDCNESTGIPLVRPDEHDISSHDKADELPTNICLFQSVIKQPRTEHVETPSKTSPKKKSNSLTKIVLRVRKKKMRDARGERWNVMMSICYGVRCHSNQSDWYWLEPDLSEHAPYFVMKWSVFSTPPILKYSNPSSRSKPSPHFFDSSVQHFRNLDAVMAAMVSRMHKVNDTGTLSTVPPNQSIVSLIRYNNVLPSVLQMKWMSSVSAISSSSDFPFLSFVFHKMVQSTSSLVGVHWQRFFPFGSFGVWQSCKRHKLHAIQWQLHDARTHQITVRRTSGEIFNITDSTLID